MAPAELIAALVNDVCPTHNYGPRRIPCDIAEVLDARHDAGSSPRHTRLPSNHRALRAELDALIDDVCPRKFIAPDDTTRVAAELTYARTASVAAVMDIGLTYQQAQHIVKRMAA
jgi:hypothetical protein